MKKISLKAKEWISNNEKEYIPASKEKYAALSGTFKKIAIDVDFDSFDGSEEDLSYVHNQLEKAYDCVHSLYNRSEVAKTELEKQLKKVALKMVKNESDRKAEFSKGTLLITSHSFANNYLNQEIADALEQGL